MNDSARFKSGLSISQARKDAKALSKRNGIKLSEAQNIIAMQHSGMKWSKAIKTLSTLQPIPTDVFTFKFPYQGATENTPLPLERGFIAFARNRPVALIVGTPGTGKSVLAMDFAKQHLNNSLPVIYLTGETESSFIASANRSKPIKTALALKQNYSQNFSILYERNNSLFATMDFSNKTLIIVDEYWLQSPIVPESSLWEKIERSDSKMLLISQKIEDFSDFDITHISFCVFGRSNSHEFRSINHQLGFIDNSFFRFIAADVNDVNRPNIMIEMNDD